MKSKTATLLVWVLSIGVTPVTVGNESFEALSTVFGEHCVKCHKGRRAKGNIDLSEIDSTAALRAKPKIIEKIISVLHDREMPPVDKSELSDATRAAMVAALRANLEKALESYPFEPTPIRRMNRFQYNNAVVDLLELDRDIFAMNERLLRRRENYFRPETRKMPDRVRVSSRPLAKDIDNQRPEGFRGVSAFPQDKRAEHGFDNRADHLTLSPLLMESFLQLSQTIVESPDLNAKECRSWNRYFAEPGEDFVLRKRIDHLLRRAFRRPADPETRDRFLKFAEVEIAAGASHESTMRTVVGAILGMPDFLYIYESPSAESSRNGGGEKEVAGRERIDDFELASRLSLFFWSSIPDDTLLDVAAAGKLSAPDTLSAQIDRMLDDRRSGRFCENFAPQWLQLERLVTAIPDRKKYPYFYYHGYRSSLHMMSEPLLLFETVYIEDRSIVELLDPKFSYRSKMLEANYRGNGKAPTEVQVQTFHRVKVDDPRQGGVITNLAVLTMTSTPTRTQPITRGAWLNGVIFNDPPEPPPADVPPLPEGDHEKIAKMTIRERLADHRKREDCAGCHNKIDPFGFALENYGPTGVWRDKYENGRDIEPDGVLFNQHEFQSAVEFKSLLLKEKDRFVRGFCAHLLSYALGRELGPADSPALDGMTEKAMAGKDQMRAVLKSVAMSEPFLRKNMRAGKGFERDSKPEKK